MGQLEYGRSQRAIWKRVAHLALSLLFLTSIVFATIYLRIPNKIRMLIAQRSCFKYVAIPNQILFEEGTGAEVRTPHDTDIFRIENENGIAWARLPPSCFVREMKMLGRNNPSANTNILYLGPLQEPGASPKLVIVGWRPRGRFENFYSTMFFWQIVDPGSMFRDPQIHGEARPFDDFGSEALSGHGVFQFRSGFVDQTNGAHCVIPYTVGGRSGHVDGWLAGDRVRLKWSGPGSRRDDLPSTPAPDR